MRGPHAAFAVGAALWSAVAAAPAAAVAQSNGYAFLGDLRSHEQTEAGFTATCEPGATLVVRFLTPAMVRVTLDRPDRDEALLEGPIARTDWPAGAIRFDETDERITLRLERLTVVLDKRPCRLSFLDAEGAILRDDAGMGIGWDGNEVRNWKTIADDERFFGLGEKTGDVDKRGREWVMWNSDTYGYGPETDPVYESIPFVIGVRGGRAYGVYLNNSYRSTFNLGAGNHRYWSFAADDGALDYFFVHGPALADVVAAYTELTGRTPMPPRWALGYQQSRWSYYPASEVLRLAKTFREKRIPADVIYLDIHYMDGYRVFTWHPERFPDPEGMLRELEEMGFKVVTIIDPGVKVDTAYAIANEGLRGDYFVRYPDGEVYVGSVWPGPSYFPDFSRPETQEWWSGHLDRLLAQGVDGFWNDMNEPAVWGKAFPLEVWMEDGGRRSSQKKMHNLYGWLMAQGTYEPLRRRHPDRRPFVVTRAGFAGIQRYAAVWTGDNVATEDHLELGIRMLLGLGLSGVPFVGTDVGGFVGTPSPELFARWMQVGAVSPFFRAHTQHGTADQEPWSFGDHVEEVSRDVILWRYRLLPYLYTLFHEAHGTGAPILRPLFWHYPDDPTAYDHRYQHQFLVGEHLLVAPVTRVGQRWKEVYLPAGAWLDLGTGEVHRGPATVVVPAPLDRLPMFLRQGGILPLQEAVQYVGERASATLTLEVFAGANRCGGELYEDDGESFEYERGGYRLTRFTCARRGHELSLERAVGHDGYAVPARRIEVRFHDVASAPSRVQLDGRALRESRDPAADGYAYDAASRTLVVRFPESGSLQRLAIRLR